MKKKSIIVGLFVFVLLLSICILYFLLQNKKQNQINFEIDTTNWQVYTNDQYGFLIKVPQSWSVIEQGTSFWINPDVPGPRDSFYAPLSLLIIENSTKLSIVDWYLENYPQNQSDVKNFEMFKIDQGISATVGYLSNDQNKVPFYYVGKEDKIYVFSLMDLQDDLIKEKMMMKTIVESFKFTK